MSLAVRCAAEVEGFIYDAFASKCKANNFKISEVLLAGIAECSTLISLAVAKREHDFREAKEAQILSIAEELGYTDADIKKLLKNSKPAEAKPAKEEKVIESRHAHKGTYEGEDVMWEVDKFNTGYHDCKFLFLHKRLLLSGNNLFLISKLSRTINAS